MIINNSLAARKYWPIATRLFTFLSTTQNHSNIKPLGTIPFRQILYPSIGTPLQKQFSNSISRFQYKQCVLHSPKLLQQKLQVYKSISRSFSFGRNTESPKHRKKRIPKLILLQNPFSWLMNKIDFRILRYVWDPHFQEKEFKFGTKQAISRVTEVLSGGHYEDLNGLLTKAAKSSLLRELDRNWGVKQRTLLALKREDIQISSPRKVYFIRIGDKIFCDVDMAFLALKWTPINSIDTLIFTEIFARFHREYTPYSIPEWTIAYFKVTRFEVLRR